MTPKERRQALAVALRASLPKGFRWDYSTWWNERRDCGTAGCAIGLAHLMWPHAGLLDEDHAPNDSIIFDFFGMTEEQAAHCFWGPHPKTGMLRDITKKMVAARLAAIDNT